MQLLTFFTILTAIVLFNLKDIDNKNKINNNLSLSAKEKDGYLLLSIHNKYLQREDENCQFFINSDADKKSGFHGSDFLVENGRLFSYDGMQNVWKWKFETKLECCEKTKPQDNFSTKIPIKKIISNSNNKLSIKAIINSSNWKIKNTISTKIIIKHLSLAFQ